MASSKVNLLNTVIVPQDVRVKSKVLSLVYTLGYAAASTEGSYTSDLNPLL